MTAAARKETKTRTELRPARLLIVAAIFHVVVTMCVLGIGRWAVLPSTFDGNGIAFSVAPDGVGLRADAVRLSNELSQGQMRQWLRANDPFHIKLYSICFTLLTPLFGPTILSAEPLNLFCYLAMLVLAFTLGRQIWNRRAGLIAAAGVALWPSLLLHTTQLLKDPLFIVGMLAFALVNIQLLSRNCSWSRVLLLGAIGGLLSFFSWIARDSMSDLLIATGALGAMLLIVRQFREKRLHAPNLLAMALLMALSVGVTRVVPKFRKTSLHLNRETAEQTLRTDASTTVPWSQLAARVGRVRQRFVDQYPGASSNIDSGVQLSSLRDLIRYLPRAAAIGFLAPFPNMWFEKGEQAGSAGRLLGGLETSAMYVVEAFALVVLFRRSRKGEAPARFAVAFLWSVVAMGLISLGLVVVNVGTLYRLRYVFLILLIVLASAGALQVFDCCSRMRVHKTETIVDV